MQDGAASLPVVRVVIGGSVVQAIEQGPGPGQFTDAFVDLGERAGG